MKEIKIPIISGLSIAATLALMPIQVLAKDGQVTVKDTNGHPGNFYNSSGKNFSGGFESSTNAHGKNDNNIVTIKGVNSGGQPMWDYTIYGGGNGDGTPTTPPFYYKQTSAAENNTLNVESGATVAVLVGGEGKGAKNNTVNLIDADVNNVVLGGNGTWYGQADSSGDAIHNIVNISGSTQVKYNNFTNFNSTSVMGGRATGTHQANNNEVNISGTPTIAGRIAGAAVENGNAEGNKVTITGAVTLGNGNTTVNGVISSVSNAATLKDNTVTFDNENAKMIGNAGVFGANGNNAGIHDPAGKATAEGNGVILRNGSIESDGGMAGSYMVTTSKNNYSNISGGYVRAYVYGGYSRADGYTSENDHVIMSGGKVDGGVYGNWNLKGSIKNGYVTMSGGEVGASDGVYGGWSDVAGGDVTESHVDISGTAKINGRVVGGRSDAKNVTKSYITATGGTIGKEAIGGEGKTGASENKITATGTTFKKSVIGGKSSNGAVTGSRVFLTSSKVGENIYGGNATGGKAEDNHVKLRGNNVVTGEIYGGTSTTNDASRNIVDIEDGEVGGTIFGGRGVNSFNNTVNLTRTHAKNQVNGGGVNTSGGSAHDNKITLDGAKVDGIVSGGQANSGDAAKNIVTAQNNSKINSVIGGQSSSGAAKLNEVHLSDSAVTKEIYGGYSISNNAEENVVNLTNTTANDEVYGGLSSQKAADKNTVKLNGGEAKKNVWGGYGRTGTSQNTVTIEGGAQVAGSALGAEATAGSATNNTVNVDSGKVTGDVKGAKASGSATNNTVNLKGTARVDGNVYAADASSGSGNSVNFHSGSVGGTIYGLSNTSGANNSLNVYNASTQKTAGDIANLNVLNFDGISSANGSAATAALNLNAGSTTNINNAKFQLGGTDYNVDTYAIGDGEKRYLIHNENGFTGFDETQTTKRTDNVFTIKNATTYSMNLKGLMKDDDGKSIVIQGKKKTDRTITGAFDNGEVGKYSGPAGDPTIDVGEDPNAPQNFGGLDIDTNNVPNATINLVSGDDIGEIRANSDDTINVGKDSNNPLVPGKITAKNISGAGKLNFNVPDGFSGSDTALTLTDGHPTDLSGTKISVNSDKLADNTQYTLINKTNGTINQLDRTIQKDQVYTIKNANEYSFVGESYKTDASLKKLQYSKGTQTRNWDGEFDYGETELNKITNAANNGHSLDRNKNNTVIIDANAGDLNGKKIYGGSTAAGDTLDIHDNTVEINGGTNIGDVIAGNNASSSGKVSNNVINFNAGTLSGKLYGSDDASNARGNNSGNALNVNNASTQKTAGDIKNFNALNFDGVTAATNGTIDKAALNLTTNANTDINNAKFKLNGEEYNVNKDTYGSLNIEEGKEYHLIRNAGNTFTNFTEKAKQTTNEFTLKNSTTYDIMLKGLIKSSDDQSILIQGSKLTSRKISNDGKFDGGEINKYGNIQNPVINVVNEDPNNPTNFNGLNINGGDGSTVNLTGGNNIGNITGGTGSTLNVGKDTTNPAAPNSITAKNIGGFDDINIFMPPTVKDGDSMIKLTDPTANTDLSNMRGKITAYISGNTDVGDTSTIHLIDKQGSGRLLLPDPSHLQTRVQQGATIEYETYGMVDANGRALDLRFSGKRRVKEDTKSFAETRAASLASLKSGSELITNYLDKLIPDGHLELFPFAISEAYDLRYETGSHVNSKGYGVAAGLASLTENFAGEILSGVFVEYGRANYDSYLDSGLHANGDSEYIGGGLMLKQNFTSGTYIDASFHVGKISSDYNSNDWTYAIAPGVLAHNEKFDISSTYMATHIGVGQIFDLSESNKLDVYTKWLYAYTDDADASISSGERYHFDSVTSNRLRAGLRDTINLKDEHNLYVGGAYEYEFKGDAKASTMGLDAPKPSLKGSTGVFEAGYKYDSKNLILSLGGKGYIGKTRGGAINAGFEIMF